MAFVHRRPVISPLDPLRPALRTAAALLVAVATMLALGVAAVAGGSPASAATVIPDPVSAVAAPAVTEGFSPYVPQDSCDPTIKPGTAALRALLMTTYGGRDLGITRGCDIGTTSEHKEGRAFDWGLSAAVPAEMAIATQFLTWLLAPGPNGMAALNARRLGVMYVIWDGKIWGAYRSADGWRPYTGGESHSDHIHISLSWNGAMKKTSWWTGTVAPTDYGPCLAVAGSTAPVWTAPRTTPCPAPIDPMTLTGTPLLAQGMTSPYAVQLQRLLHVTPVTGYFGPLTDAALRTFQAAHGLPVTATTTPATWIALRGATDGRDAADVGLADGDRGQVVPLGDALHGPARRLALRPRDQVALDGRRDHLGQPADEHHAAGRPGRDHPGPLRHHQVHLDDAEGGLARASR